MNQCMADLHIKYVVGSATCLIFLVKNVFLFLSDMLLPLHG